MRSDPTAFIPARPRRLRRRRPVSSASPSPAAPTLIAAAYQQAAWVRLTFDVDIDITALDVQAIVVSDANTGDAMHGTGTPTQPTPQSVQVSLQGFGPATGPGVTLTADGQTGIVSAADELPWAGATAVAIPFG